MKKFLLWIWQLPQHILGLIVILVSNAKLVNKDKGSFEKFYSTVHRFGVSLGEYRIIYEACDEINLKHEYGHTLQSRMLGPLYLIMIGLPSVIGNLLWRFRKFDYYKQPWERWADKLGKVERK